MGGKNCAGGYSSGDASLVQHGEALQGVEIGRRVQKRWGCHIK